MSNLRVLVIGYNAFDVLLPFAGLPVPDHKHEVAAIHMGGGGPGATAAVALAKLGAAVTLVTPLCGDVPGQIQEAELLAAGVDVSLAPRHPEALTPKAVILVDESAEERIIFWSRGALPAINPTEVEASWLDGMDMLYTDGHETAAASKLARLARERNLPVVMDAGSVREGSDELVALCTDVISSSGFAPTLTGFDEPTQALSALAEMGPSRVALTLGSGGVLALKEDGRLERIPALVSPVIDTTGAGDVFHAGYAFARGHGLSFEKSLEFGNATAALKCRDWGGRRGLPTKAEVDELLTQGKPKPWP